MGKEYNDMKKKATRDIITQLSDGEGLTVADIKRKVDFKYGLGEKWVLNFLELYSNGLEEENGVYRWKM